MPIEQIMFTPEVGLDPGQAPTDATIKGESPRLDYSFTLLDIYPTVPALDVHQAYQKIRGELDRLDNLLSHKLKLRGSVRLPRASTGIEASYLLSVLFDPASYYTDGIWQTLTVPASVYTDLFRLDQALPFPLQLASPQKLIHTLMWIDTNVKVIVERATEPYQVPAAIVRQIVESTLQIYSYLVKQQDYQLARSINFNYSMFLQDRILNVIFGDAIYMAVDRLYEHGKLANRIALQLLKGLGNLSYQQLCALSTFMGVIWTSREETRRDFASNPDATLGHIETELNAQRANWCINHTNQFLADMQADSEKTIVVVLDDNGESVFDIALFQRLLNNTGHLQVTFVINRYPISNNISLHTFQTLLQAPYFMDLGRHLESGRASLCVERQVFRSFELAYLQPETRRAIHNSQATYIKGVNFFETFQLPDVTRYHCFTVHGHTSMLLTGCPEGKGIFVNLKPGQPGYTYRPRQVETLRDQIASTKQKE